MYETEAPQCCYCHLPVDPVSDCWIGHRQMAHYQCIWAADGAFWAVQEAQEDGAAEEKGHAKHA